MGTAGTSLELANIALPPFNVMILSGGLPDVLLGLRRPNSSATLSAQACSVTQAVCSPYCSPAFLRTGLGLTAI